MSNFSQFICSDFLWRKHSSVLHWQHRLLLVFIMALGIPSLAKADTWYSADQVEVYKESNHLVIKYLRYDHEGTDDALNWIKFWYLNPNNHQYVFVSDCSRDGGPSWGGAWTESRGDKDYTCFRWYYPTGVFNGTVDLLFNYRWTVDITDCYWCPDPKPREGWFFKDQYVNDTKNYYDYIWSAYFADDNAVDFSFQIYQLYGKDVWYEGQKAPEHRNELDDIVISYYDNGTWNDIFHGDCDNSFTDYDLQTFSKTSDGSIVISKWNRSSSDVFATVKWNTIPAHLLGKTVKFRVSYMWDLWPSNTNSGITGAKEFSYYIKPKYVPQNYTVAFDTCAQKVRINWTIPSSENSRILNFNVDKSYPNYAGTPYEEYNRTYAGIDVNTNTSYIDDEIEHGKTYWYNVATHYKDGTYWLDRGDAVKIDVDFRPSTPSNFKAVSHKTNEGDCVVKVSWVYNCSRSSELVLTRKNNKTGVSNDITLAVDVQEYIDTDIETCVIYTYSLKAKNSYGFRSTPFVDALVDEGIYDALSDLKTSKGYFSNKVVVEWSNNKKNLIDYYMVYRKRYGSNQDSSLVKITETSKTTAFVDESTDPGIFYQYFVLGKGTCGEFESTSNILSDIGFRQPVGTISGQVNYEGGTPVPNVRVALDLADMGQKLGRCLSLGGSDSLLVPDNGKFDLADGFTSELWIKTDSMAGTFTLFDKLSGNTGFKLDYSPVNKLFTLNVGAIQFQFDDSLCDKNEFNHVALTKGGNNLIRVYINGITAYETQQVYVDNNVPFTFGNHLVGYMDEIRVWKTYTSNTKMLANYNRMLTGEEKDLVGYWRLDEGVGKFIFDISKNVDKFNNNHGTMVGALWSDDVPSLDQLALCGLTDEFGNYLINGIRYAGTGQNFKITPMFGQHSFNPNTRSVFIGDGSLIFNNQNFEDNSSFPISGRIKYRNTNFPVEGAYVKVDGTFVMGDDQMPVMTNADGAFTVRVPIGEHYISVEKQGHLFQEAYFPPRVDGNIQYYDFQQSLTGLQFVDTTLVKLAGRVVGGTREGNKKIGFGYSVNNIGVCSITLRSFKEKDLDEKQNESSKDTIYYTNKETGEYEAWLLPEKYIVSAVGNSDYVFDVESYGNVVDLTSAYTTQYEADSVFKDVYHDNGTITQVFDSIAVYEYNAKKSWVYRQDPEMDVLANNGTPHFYDAYVMSGEDKISTIDENGKPLFGFPILTYDKNYSVNVSVFERYQNNDVDAPITEDKVPVTDGSVLITTEMALDHSARELALDGKGEAKYVFRGGFPNTMEDENSDYSYTKTMSIAAKTGVGKFAYWPSGSEPFRAYVLGGRPTGNNFVTTGPTEVDFILRDPPGSDSYAYFESGFTATSSTTYDLSQGNSGSEKVVHQFGAKVETVSGTPFFSVVNEFESDNAVGVKFEHEETWSESNSSSNTTTFTQAYSTSDDPAYVGSMGDIFIGHATNIVFGKTIIFQPEKVSNLTGTEARIDSTVNGYTLAFKTGLRLSPEFSTAYSYTQNHIENYLIPNLKELRNLLFVNRPARYVSLISSNDERYGTNNDDSKAWNSEAAIMDSNGNGVYNGPSYQFIPLAATDPNWEQDSIRWYNEQIKQWEKILAQNEQEKLKAKMDENHTNISFDAGTTYESSIETEYEETSSNSYEWTISPGLAAEFGFAINGFGIKTEIEESYSRSRNTTTENTSTKSKTVGFVLADGDQGDYYTVDVKKCQSGNGPVFSVRGGQSACPDEGEELTKYYRAGSEVLNYATMHVEAPTISVNKAVVNGVPETHPATYTLSLGNDTEAGADNWYMVTVDASSNPNGAKLKLDGAPLVNGVSIMIPANTTLNKSLELWKGEANKYENVNIIIHSLCQFDPTDDVADISDTVSVSAYFIPACSEVAFLSPNDQWLVNYASRDTLDIRMNDFNAQLSTFSKIEFQFKAQASSQWLTLHTWFKDVDDFTAFNDQNKSLIGTKTVLDYRWDMTGLPDRSYQIRAKSICSDESVFTTEPLTGVLDGKRPKIFGTPQPADGILSVGEDISIRFDEPIEAGLLGADNFELKGVLNNSLLNHGASLQFDGNSTSMEAGSGLQLMDKSYTIEFWMNADSTVDGNILSYTTNGSNGLIISSKANEFEVKVNGVSHIVDYLCRGNWHHYAVVYNNTNQQLQVLEDDKVFAEFTAQAISTEANLVLGSNAYQNSFTGWMHDLRVWSKPLQKSEVVSKMNLTLSGYEMGLIGYWPLDEGFGNLFVDKASKRNATGNAEWSVTPASSSYAFDGAGKALIANTGTIPVDAETDMTIELWLKAGSNANNSTVLSNGNPGVQTDAINQIVTLSVNSSGKLVVQSNNRTLTSNQNVTNNEWHHVAVVVNRRGNASLYVDGNKEANRKGSEFGALMGAKMCIGALSSSDGVSVSDYFNGNIDEVRIWSTARSQELLAMYRNTKLSGNEAGLLAYFPFDTYSNLGGVLVSATTLNDQSVDEYSSAGHGHCGALTVVGGENFSTISPNIKRENSRTDVGYFFTVNDDEIIITPTVPQATLEKAILEITVKGVEDLNGNRLASPVSWTAYVDKNTVKWMENSIAMEKGVNDAVSFNVSIQNAGGTYESYSLENIPSWLTAYPSSGIIGPNKSLDIEFTIQPGLNIGMYNEEVYLHTDFGFDEKLNLSLRVKGEEPVWQVNPADFASSMSFVGRISIGDLVSTDTYDKIGVFAGSECRGVAKVQYFAPIDDYLVMLVVYGNINDETLQYRVYDASTGETYMSVTPSYKFTAEMVYGDFVHPILFECGNTIKNTIALNKGWSWLSFNTTLNAYSSITQLMSGIQAVEGDRIIDDAEMKTKRYEGDVIGWQGPLTMPGNDRMYRFYVKNGGELNLEGSAIDPQMFQISVVNGWNRIGYLPQINIEINEALSAYPASTNDVIKGQLGFAMYNGFTWLGNLDYLKPGKGYMLKRNNSEAVNFKYPKGSSFTTKSATIDANEAVFNSFGINPYNFSNSASVLASIQGVSITGDAVVLAYVNGDLRGAAQVNDSYQYITVFGNESEIGIPIAFKLQMGGEVLDLSSSCIFNGNEAMGTFTHPIVLKAMSTANQVELAVKNGVSFYPNPMQNNAQILFNLSEAQNVEITVFNALGQCVYQFTPQTIQAGKHSISWDAAMLSTGTYNVKVKMGESIKMIQVNKVK